MYNIFLYQFVKQLTYKTQIATVTRKKFLWVDLAKLTRYLKSKPNEPDPTLDPISENAQLKVDLKPELTQPEIADEVNYFCMISLLDQNSIGL